MCVLLILGSPSVCPPHLAERRVVGCGDVVTSSWCEEETLGDFLRKNIGNWVSVSGKRPHGATDKAAEQWEPEVSPCSLFIMTTSVPSHLFLNFPAYFLCSALGVKVEWVRGTPLSFSSGIAALNSEEFIIVRIRFGIELFPWEGAMSPSLPQCPHPKIKLRSRDWVWLIEVFLGLFPGLGGYLSGHLWLFKWV